MKTTHTLVLLFLLSISLHAQSTIPKYNILEIDLSYSAVGIVNVWEGVDARVTFTSPSNRSIVVGGFYFSANLWKVRFVPDETGQWTWTSTVSGKNGSSQRTGSFTCIASNEKGFIRKHPTNPFRWIHEADSTLFNGIGFGDCMSSDTMRSIYGDWGFDGGIRMPASHGEAPAWSASFETYLTAYGEVAGMNLIRISDGNCAFSIKKLIDPNGNQYSEVFSKRADTICMAFRKHGFRIFYDIGGWNPPFIQNSSDTGKMNAVKRWLKYCVDRWGAYVDFWELMNEKSGVDNQWYTIAANYIRSIDPYHHLISTSYEQPAHPAIDIISPHWYGTEAATASDLETANRIKNFKQYNKPIMYGEQGNTNRNWDLTSALRMRGRIWSAFFNEGILMFWNSSYARDNGGGAANLYLGSEERQYVKALQTFAGQLDKDIRVVQVPVQGEGIRSYGLRSAKVFAAYIRSGTSITATNKNISVTVDVPTNGTASWYDVKTGEVIFTQSLSAGIHTIPVPDFICDIALLVGAPIAPTPNYFQVAIESRDIGFDSVDVGKSKEITTRIINVGKDNIVIQGLGTSGAFPQMFSAASNPLPFMLVPKDSASLRIRYAPTVLGIQTAHVVVTHSGSLVPEFIAVKGKGILATAVNIIGQPISIELSQNYPNPFSDRTTIDLTLSLSSQERVPEGRVRLTLKVYDLLGREVLDLSDQARSASQITIHKSQLPEGGVYFYRLTDGNNSQTKMMVMMR